MEVRSWEGGGGSGGSERRSRHGVAGDAGTYVYLGDRYINNATHNNQGVKCVPCITEIVLHGRGAGVGSGGGPTTERNKTRGGGR